MRSLIFVCAVLLAGLLSGPADARSRDRGNSYQSDDEDRYQVDEDRRERRDYRERNAEAGRKALTRNGGGRVLSIETLGPSSYRVKVLKDGEVRVHMIELN